ncbi:MAG: hypothetical protein HY725_22355 [Candidatus Rokubacteria bacterium]|nr:hypothetical protein [Candidatus Rokubacteria bacterium]
MGIVELPVVSHTAPLREAFRVMQESRRSAVVVRDGHDLWLIEAVDVVRGIKEGKTSLAEVTDRQRLAAPSAHRLASRGVSLIRPTDTWRELESILDEDQEDYAVLAADAEQAVVISRHEPGVARLEPAPRTCYCTWKPRCDGRGSRTGDDCDLGHRGTIHCVS